MKHYVQTDETGRILVTVEDEAYTDETYSEFEFPEDFDFSRQSDYRIVDGVLVHEVAPPTEEELALARERQRRAQMEAAVSLFVRSADLTDEQAASVSSLHEDWAPGTPYADGDRRLYEGRLYRCIQDHVSNESWTPMAAPSLWAPVLPGQSGDVGVWEQPGPTNPYQFGDRVTHNGKTWVSDIDGNVWEPGVYGWSEVS